MFKRFLIRLFAQYTSEYVPSHFFSHFVLKKKKKRISTAILTVKNKNTSKNDSFKSKKTYPKASIFVLTTLNF